MRTYIREKSRNQILETFPRLKLLESLSQQYSSYHLKDVLVVGTQHLNETTGSLIQTLITIGFRPENIMLLGKNYSSNPSSVLKLRKLGCEVFMPALNVEFGEFAEVNMTHISNLWQKAKEKLRLNMFSGLIILDDGGRFIETTPEEVCRNYKIASVEQTTKGIRSESVLNSTFPVVSVASSRLKRNIESATIAKGIVNSIKRIDLKNKKIGIIGLGNVGKSLKKIFLQQNIKVKAFDSVTSHFDEYRNVEDLIIDSDIVFGCTGTTLDFDLSCLYKKNTILASCSSEDLEFKKLINLNLKPIKVLNKFTSPDLIFKFDFGEVRLLNSGFPVNFRNDMEVESQKEIQLTRGLLFLGIIQAIQHLKTNTLKAGINQIIADHEDMLEILYKEHLATV